MNELLNFTNYTFFESIVMLFLIALLLSALTFLLYIFIKKLISNRDVEIGDFIKINSQSKNSDIPALKNEIVDFISSEEIKTIQNCVMSVANLQEALYKITDRILESYEGLLLMSKSGIHDIFMSEDLSNDFLKFKKVLTKSRKQTINKVINVATSSEFKEELEVAILNSLIYFIKVNYEEFEVPHKEFVMKLNDLKPDLLSMLKSCNINCEEFNIIKKRNIRKKKISSIIENFIKENNNGRNKLSR